MAKSKKRRQGNSSLPAPVSMQKLAPAGYEVRTFEISDEVKDTYKPGVMDEIAEATAMLRRGRLDEAKAAFQGIIEREPRAREAYANLAVTYMQSGDEEAAEALLRETADKFPLYVFPRINLALIHLRRGQADEAEEMLVSLDELRKFTPGEFRIYALTWSDVLAAQGEYEGAILWLRLLSDALPGSPGLWERRIRYWVGRLFHRGRGGS
jgi:tetratricopeptide (TPR) repeat protein